MRSTKFLKVRNAVYVWGCALAMIWLTAQWILGLR